MSLANEASLLLIPSGYKSGKVYSVFPTDGDGDFTFTRGSDGTRVGAGGLVETISSNTPRLDYFNSDCPSLLLEPQRTNLMLFSEEFSGTNWSSVRTSLTSNTIISPDGQITADKLQRTSTSGSYRTHNISKSGAITYTTSVFIKKGSDDYFSMRAQGSYPSRVDIRFRFDTEQIYYAQSVSNFTLIDSDVQSYSNGWYRIFFTYTTDTHSNLAVSFSPRASNGNIDSGDISSDSFAYVWGAQTEEGSYPTSYIKTTSSTVTRLKDVCINGGDSDLFNITEGTFFVDVTPYESTTLHWIVLSDGSSSNRVSFLFQVNNTQLRCLITSNGVTQLDAYKSLGRFSRSKLLITFKGNECKIYINGTLVHTDTSFIVPVNLDRLNFARDNGNSSFFNGKVHDTRVYDRVLTQAEAIELTTL